MYIGTKRLSNHSIKYANDLLTSLIFDYEAKKQKKVIYFSQHTLETFTVKWMEEMEQGLFYCLNFRKRTLCCSMVEKNILQCYTKFYSFSHSLTFLCCVVMKLYSTSVLDLCQNNKIYMRRGKIFRKKNFLFSSCLMVLLNFTSCRHFFDIKDGFMRNGILFYCNMCQINILLNRFHVRLIPLTEDKNVN